MKSSYIGCAYKGEADMDQFNVEDAFFGALLGAWCSKVGGFWTDISSLVMLALLFLLFGTFFRVISGSYLRSNKVLFAVIFVLASVLIISQFYYRIEDSKKQEIIFFASMFMVWIAISLIKIAHYRLHNLRLSRNKGINRNV